MFIKKNQQVGFVYDNRLMDNEPACGSSGGEKGTEGNPYSIFEFLEKLQNGTWTGGHVQGMGYVSADNFIQSSEGVSEDYGSEYGDNITRYSYSPHSSFDLDSYFGSLFSFLNEAPTTTPTGQSSGSSSNGNGGDSPRHMNIAKSTYTIENTLLLEVERMTSANNCFYSIKYKLLSSTHVNIKACYTEFGIDPIYTNLKDIYTPSNEFLDLANMAIAKIPETNPSFSLRITIGNSQPVELKIL